MSSRLRAVPLAEFVSKVVGGGTPARSVAGNWAGPIPWASVKDLAQDQLILEDTKEHISERALHGSAANLVPAGTPIVCTRMAVGRVAVPSVDIAINQDLKALIPRSDTDARYLLHGVHFLQRRLEGMATGSTVKGLQLRELLNFQLLKPTLSQQRHIGEVLDALDGEIRLTANILHKLDLVGRGLMEDLLSCGVDPTGALRPQESFESRRGDFGSFPASWSVVRLDQIAVVDRGKFGHRPRNDPMYLTGPFPFIQTGDVAAADGGVIVNTSQSLSRLGAAVSREFAAGTIAVTIAANIGDTAILGRPMYFPDSVVGVSVRAPHRVEYVQSVLRAAKPRLEARAPQSAQRNINLQDLRPLEVPLPDPAEQGRICQVMEAHEGRLAVERNTLAKLRKQKLALLDDLLTGRVRVAGAPS
jgi:type I restriction enzyme S subunit